MAAGPGKYDSYATMVREGTQADGVIVVVFGGTQGSGFSVQGGPDLTLRLPDLLEHIAKQIREDLRG